MSGDVEQTTVERCDFCRQPCSVETLPLEYEGETYTFCSEACRSAMADSDRVFTEYHGHRRFDTGVTGIDDSLPQGVPRNAFVMLPGHSGTREEAILAELVWRTLERGEPAVIVAFTEPPISVIENFLAMEWNVLPYLERGQLRVLDCFTYRVDDRERLYDRMTPWNQHLDDVIGPHTRSVRDPSDGHELRNALDSVLEELEMVETGIVTVDSIAEFGSLVQPVQAYDFVKDVRAEVCKGRFVPVFAGATVVGERDAFPRDLDYVVDGVIDLRLEGDIIEDTLFRRLRVRKMRGVLTVSEWYTYEYTSGLGLVTFDPRAERERSRREAAEGAANSPAEGRDGPPGAGSDQEGTAEGGLEADEPVPDGERRAPDGDEPATDGDEGSRDGDEGFRDGDGDDRDGDDRDGDDGPVAVDTDDRADDDGSGR